MNMGGFLTARQCSTCTESLKDHSLWDFFRTWVRRSIWYIFIIVIVLTGTFLIIYYSQAPSAPELDSKCPKDQAKLLHNSSQLVAENLRKQLAKMKKEMQKLKSDTGQTEKKTLQPLEKKQEEADALSKELSVSNQSLVQTRQLLEKEKEKVQSLQSHAQKDLQKIQQQRDSCQKELNTLKEKLRSPDSKAEGYKVTIAKLQTQIEQEKRNRDIFIKERDAHQRTIVELRDQIARQSPTPNISEYGYNAISVLVCLSILICCVQCCRKNW